MFPEKKIIMLYSYLCLCRGESTIGNQSGFRLQGFSFYHGKMGDRYALTWLQEAGIADVFQP